jgi:hypothetical protein
MSLQSLFSSIPAFVIGIFSMVAASMLHTRLFRRPSGLSDRIYRWVTEGLAPRREFHFPYMHPARAVVGVPLIFAIATLSFLGLIAILSIVHSLLSAAARAGGLL